MSEELTEEKGAAAPEPGAETEAARMDPEPGPELPRRRQWVTLRGTSLDLRVGAGLLQNIASDFASAIGRPREAVLASTPSASADAVETLRRSLTDKGFLVKKIDLPEADAARSFSALTDLYAAFAQAGITADDFVVGVGDGCALSLCAAACAHWCGQVMFAAVPCDLASALTCGVCPRPLDVPGAPRMVAYDGSARFEVCDLNLLLPASSAENRLLGRAHMVAAAMVDCEKSFGTLWDAADLIAADDPAILVDAVTDCVRSMGKVASSTSVAIRQSVEYGQTIRRALRSVVPADVPESTLMADALRISARLSVAREELPIDDMFTQDDLLERLGLGTVSCPVGADALVEAIKSERFSRSNRFVLNLPRALGRVRLAAVDTDMLCEHIGAWCAAR
ncbi:3-dehydroquinate synthase [Paratractidigestivibacter sp.]|uniref:3-dehydroquinate synthase n=1 Tax=Paratractidigestivibacter sp. TaxID=2847316 RepID=UPI002ACB105B|nr:3-dehydroquinate synthase [Paratractidigestivibacter sp.]